LYQQLLLEADNLQERDAVIVSEESDVNAGHVAADRFRVARRGLHLPRERRHRQAVLHTQCVSCVSADSTDRAAKEIHQTGS